MFNRLIAAYFLQAKGIFDGNPHYLSDRLQQAQEQQGQNTFYHHVLLPFFHEYLGAPTPSQQVAEQHGHIPALNLSLFKRHHLEQQITGVQIPDDAFARLRAIISERRLIAGNRMIRGGYRCVVKSVVPTRTIALRRQPLLRPL